MADSINNISHKTTIGYCLQSLAELTLKKQNIEFDSNVKYYDCYIAPDIFIGSPPEFSIHVTCSQGDDSLTMKKWRYVAEITQIRSVYSGDCHTINLMFGPTDDLMEGDRKLLKGLFDSTIFVENIENGNRLYNEVHLLTEKGLNTKQSIDEIVKFDWVSQHLEDLGSDINTIISTKKGTKWSNHLCEKLKNNHANRIKNLENINIPKTGIAWKRSLLRVLCVNEIYWNDLFNIKINNFSKNILNHLISCKIIKTRKTLRINYYFEDEWVNSINNGLDISAAKILKNRILNDNRRKYEILDLWDDGERSIKAIKEFVNTFKKGKNKFIEYLNYSLESGGSQLVSHHRAHPFDIIIILLNISQNGIQQRLGKIPFGVKDSIRNLVPRTDIALNYINNNKEITNYVSTLTYNKFSDQIKNELSLVSELDLQKKYLNYRIYCITKGSSINSLKEVILDYFLKNNNFTIEEKTRLTVNNEIIGKFTTDFELVAKDINGTIFLVKCIFGDSGADHKSEEMDGRIKTFKLFSEKYKNAKSIFIADGYWSRKQINSLYLAGWDYICSCNQLSNILSKF